MHILRDQEAHENRILIQHNKRGQKERETLVVFPKKIPGWGK